MERLVGDVKRVYFGNVAMKHTLRIPTQDQYAFIESELEGTAEEAVAEYRKMTSLVRFGDGLETDEWNRVLGVYLTSRSMKAEEYEAMNQFQQGMIQELKKAFKRITK